MSVSLTTFPFNHRGTSSHPHDTPQRTSSGMSNSSNRHSLFGSFRKSLSRKGSNSTSSTSSTPKSTSSRPGNLPPLRFDNNNNNPFLTTSQPTRRPNRVGMNVFSPPADEPPPAYTAGPAAGKSTGAAPAPNTAPPSNLASGSDDSYAFLKSFDTIFLIDDSGSMAGRSWREVGNALKIITPICTQRDADGIDIYFLNHPDSTMYKNVTSTATIVEIFQTVRPCGGTPTGQRLNKILRPYLKDYEKHPDTTKPINIIVITDGEPSDDVESPIIQAAKKLDKLDAPAWQVGIQFFQVGKEPGAREHLKQLDDGLAEVAGDDELRDIVDTVPFKGAGDEELSAAGIMKVVLGSVNRRLDRNSKELHRRK